MVSLVFIKRSANQGAHHLARASIDFSERSFTEYYALIGFLNVLMHDISS